MKINRLQAFAIHLLLSIGIFVLLLLAMWCWFFPGALFAAAGGWRGMQIIALVDLVLGPCLTLIVFNPKKPVRELRRDLGVIGLVQALALIGGLYAVNLARPLLLVYVYDTFYVHDLESLQQAGLDSAEQKRLIGWLPRFYYVPIPGGTEEFLQQNIQGVLSGEKPLQDRFELFKAMPEDPAEVKSLLQPLDKKTASCQRLAIESAYETGFVCLDAQRMRLYDFSRE